MNKRIRKYCIPMWAILLASANWFPLTAQMPVVEGNSSAFRGYVEYDRELVETHEDYRLAYTIEIEPNSCIELNYDSEAYPALADELTVESYREGAETPELIQLKSDGRLLRLVADEVRVSFLRNMASMEAKWGLEWQVFEGPGCGGHERLSELFLNSEFTCGPVYNGTASIKSEEVPQQYTAWRQIQITADGQLEFSIQALDDQNDFDFLLYRMPPDSLAASTKREECLVAQNHAKGQGPEGKTGMNNSGRRYSEAETGNPFCREIAVRKGEVYLLHLLTNAPSPAGYHLELGASVMGCETQEDQMGVKMPQRIHPPGITRMENLPLDRISLPEKANRLLVEWERGTTSRVLEFAGASGQEGLPALLIQGLQVGKIPAYRPTDIQSRLTYGDLITWMEQENTNQAYEWEGDAERWDRISTTIEIVRPPRRSTRQGTPQATAQPLFIRLLYTDIRPNKAVIPVATFRYEDVRPYLREIAVPHPLNDAAEMSLDRVLENRQYNARRYGQPHQSGPSPEEQEEN